MLFRHANRVVLAIIHPLCGKTCHVLFIQLPAEGSIHTPNYELQGPLQNQSSQKCGDYWGENPKPNNKTGVSSNSGVRVGVPMDAK